MLEANHELYRLNYITDTHILPHFNSIYPFSYLNFNIKNDFVAIKHFFFSFPISLIYSKLFNDFVACWRGRIDPRLVNFSNLSGPLHPLQMLVNSYWISIRIIRNGICFKYFLLLYFFLRDYIIWIFNQVRACNCVICSYSWRLHVSWLRHYGSGSVGQIGLKSALLKLLLNFF